MTRVADPLQQRIEIGLLDRWKCFRRIGEISDQRFFGGHGRPQRAAPRRALIIFPKPPFVANQGHETDIGDVFAEIFPGRDAGDPYQLLRALIGADRDHQPAADLELLLEQLGHLRPAGGDDDGIVRRMFRPALGAVAMQDVDVVVTEVGQGFRRLFGKLAEALDRVNLRGYFRQHCCRIAGARADLEDFFAALEHQGFRHEGDDIGLGDGLFARDRERRILIGEFAQVLGQE